MNVQLISSKDIETFLRQRIASDLDMDENTIQADTDLTEIGLSSVLISFIEGDLESWLGVEIPPAMLFQMSNIGEAAKVLEELQKTSLSENIN